MLSSTQTEVACGASSAVQVKDLAHNAVREQVPGLVAASISSYVPAMIDEVGAGVVPQCTQCLTGSQGLS